MSGDEDADALFVIFLDGFRRFDSFVEVVHMNGRKPLHLEETNDIDPFRIQWQYAIVRDIKPCFQLGDVGSGVSFDDSVIGIITYETVQFTSCNGRTKHGPHLLGGLSFLLFRNPDLPIIGKDLSRLTLETLCASVKHVRMLRVGEFVGCIEIGLEMAAIAGILRSINHIGAADTTAVVIHVSTAFLEGMVAIGECRNHKALVAVLGAAQAVAGHGFKRFLQHGSLVQTLGHAPINLISAILVENIADNVFSGGIRRRSVVEGFEGLALVSSSSLAATTVRP